MELLVQSLLSKQNRSSTFRTYLSIWRQFNTFLMNLDVMPPTWEHRTTLFIAHMIDRGRQSASVKSYVSAIKKLLILHGYKWKDDEVLVHSLTRACRLINDKVNTKLPIHCSLLEMILFEVERIFKLDSQIYLEYLYKAIFAISYYGMMRIGEVTFSQHVLKARNVHIALNKDKILLVLYSSKTHGLSSRPQKIKITSNRAEKLGKYLHRNFCPFTILRHYMKLRGSYDSDTEPFFIFKDKSPVTGQLTAKLLKQIIKAIGLDQQVNSYSMHCFRIGRTGDLIRFGYSLEEVRRLGRWKSNVVYKYIRP